MQLISVEINCQVTHPHENSHAKAINRKETLEETRHLKSCVEKPDGKVLSRASPNHRDRRRGNTYPTA